MKRIVPCGLIAVGIYWCIMSMQYGLWVRKGPGGGFLSMVAGILTVAIGILVLMENWKDKDKGNFNIKVFLPIGVMVAMAISSKFIGLIPAIIIYLFCWLKFYSKAGIKTTMLVTVLCPLAIYGIFAVWLKVPLPAGFWAMM